MNVRSQVHMENFRSHIRELAQAAGETVEKVTESEAQAVLQACVRATPAAKVAKIRERVENQEFGYYDTREFTPKKPSKAPITKNGYKRYYLLNRYPKALWKIIAAQRKADLQSRLRARGLAKQSWLLLAEAFGFMLDAPGYVAGALSKRRKGGASNVSAQRLQTPHGLVLRGSNAQPTLKWVGGRRILARAMAGRKKFFETNLKRGVFDDARTIAAKYPGLKSR